MFQRILVPLDGSTRAERALPIAARIARTAGGTLILLRAVIIPVGYGYGPYLMQGSAFIERDTEDELEAKRYLADISTSDALAGIPTETTVLHGAPALALLDAIPQHHVDLVIICSHGYTGVKRWVLGSVVHEIARHGSAPVLILREDHVLPVDLSSEAAPPHYTYGIVVALDGSERSLAAIEPAAWLAAALATPSAKGILHLTQVFPLPPPSELDESIDLAIREQVLSGAGKYMSRVADDLREGLAKELNLQVNWSIIVDTDVAHGLITTAEKEEASDGRYDLIAMTTHGQGRRLHWPIGTVTERVLSATTLPLLVVRPQETEPEQAEYEPAEAEPSLSKL
jgi:nucleotide-binding universal stress UspA family protein